jgi:drug/metabolite transporter (DMT)-like permease
MLAVFFRSNAAPTHDWETVRGRLAVGVGICLAAALCQASGSIIAKPAMMAGADPIAASTVRVGTAAFLLLATGLLPAGFLPVPGVTLRAMLQPRVLLPTAISGFLGLGLGMTFLLIGLAYGKAGVVATLSATSPVLVLPLQWALTRQRPGIGGWIGALVAVMGVALIVNR